MMQLGVPLSFVVLYLMLGDPTLLERTRHADLDVPYRTSVFVQTDQGLDWLAHAASRWPKASSFGTRTPQ